jgi:hypothetical protein
MTNDVSPPVAALDYEMVTDNILREASFQASISRSDDKIDVVHGYKHHQQHDPAVAMLLTVKVRKYSRLRYRQTLLGIHTFFVS